MEVVLGIGITCAGFLGFFTLLFGTLVLIRWIRYRETLAMVERGLTPAEVPKARNGNGKGTLVWGIIVTAVGLALMCGFLAWFSVPMLTMGTMTMGDLSSVAIAGMLATPGLMVIFIGVALIIIYFVTRPEPTAEPLEETPPLAELDEPAAELLEEIPPLAELEDPTPEE
jgi:hypothetical protein